MTVIGLIKTLFHNAALPTPPVVQTVMPDADPDAPAHAAAPARPDTNDQLKALVETQRGTSPTLMAGSIELVGLDEIKEALGARWAPLAARASALAELSIRRRLSDADVLQVLGDTEFSICFARLDKAAALDKARQIARDVKREILAELPEFSSTLAIKPYVAEIELGELAGGMGSLADLLVSDLRRMRLEAERAILNYRRLLLKDFKVLFSPVWDPHRAMVDVNRCVLDLSLGCKTLSQFQTIADPDQMTQTLADLDCLALMRGLEALHRHGRAGAASTLLLPVGYQTLARAATRREYFKLLSSIPEVYHSLLRLEITNLPQRPDTDQLNTVLHTVGAAKLGLAIQVNAGSDFLKTVDPTGLWGLSWNLTAGQLHGATLRCIGAPFWAYAKQHRLRTLAHGANTMGLALAAVEVGFDYVSGTAIHLSQEMPRPPSRMHPLTIPRGMSA